MFEGLFLYEKYTELKDKLLKDRLVHTVAIRNGLPPG